MFSRVETEPTPPRAVSQAPPRQGLRVGALVAAGVVALFCIVLLADELAVARVPQHRAALERLVRAQTGLDIRFDELGLRWGWYGPEAVFRRVELGEPRRSAVLLRAPELVVGFDVGETLAVGRAGGQGVGSRADRAPSGGDGAAAQGSSRGRNAANPAPVADGVRLLEGWQGGRGGFGGGTWRV